MKVHIYYLLLKIIISKLILILFLISFKYNKKKENFYVTLTSWKGRINFIYKNLERLLNNNIQPKKLILNLAIEEFPKKNLELPKKLLYLIILI